MQCLAAKQRILDANRGDDDDNDADTKAQQQELTLMENIIHLAVNSLVHMNEALVHAKISLCVNNATLSAAACRASLEIGTLANKIYNGKNDTPKIVTMYDAVLMILAGKGARRCGKQVYYPYFQKNEQGERFFTYTWVPFNKTLAEKNPDTDVKSTIRDFMYYEVQRNHPELWEELMMPATLLQKVIDTLELLITPLFPDLSRKRTLFAFTNCLFDTASLEIFPYEPDAPNSATKLDPSTVAVNYIPLPMPLAKIQEALESEKAEEHIGADEQWKRGFYIPTPSIQSIFDSQNWKDEVAMWWYMLTGRMFHPVGYDNWQVALLLKGLPGTGKSTIARVVQSLIADDLFGTMMNKGRTQFQVEHLMKKMIAIAFDVDRDFNMERTRLNSMVTGEPMSIEGIYKETQNITKWTTQTQFIGNEICFAHMGAARRFPMGIFDVMIRNVDPNLFEKCIQESPAFLYKISYMYKYARDAYKHIDIWKKLPTYFHDTRRTLMTESNAVAGFIHCSGVIDLDANAMMPLSEFKNLFQAFCSQNSQTCKWTKDVVDHAFGEFGIRQFDIGQGKMLRGVMQKQQQQQQQPNLDLGEEFVMPPPVAAPASPAIVAAPVARSNHAKRMAEFEAALDDENIEEEEGEGEAFFRPRTTTTTNKKKRKRQSAAMDR